MLTSLMVYGNVVFMIFQECSNHFSEENANIFQQIVGKRSLYQEIGHFKVIQNFQIYFRLNRMQSDWSH